MNFKFPAKREARTPAPDERPRRGYLWISLTGTVSMCYLPQRYIIHFPGETNARSRAGVDNNRSEQWIIWTVGGVIQKQAWARRFTPAMTEYDYSPEAWERYMQTQQRIAQWVDQTERHRPEFNSDTEPRTRPSLLKRLTHRRQSHSMHEPRRRRGSFSSWSSSSSSSELYSSGPLSPGPMPLSTFQTIYARPQTTPPAAAYHHSKHSGSRHHHHSSHHSPKYVLSPPISPPAQGYPYPYGVATSPGQIASPGSYVYPARAGATTVGTPSYFQPAQPGHLSQTSYPFPATYPQTRPAPQTAPAAAYPYYSQAPIPPLASPPAQYPQSAAYPPMIYPLPGSGGQQQQVPQKPVFYQRIFSGGGSGNKKGKKSSRRSH
ncbi:hypothetical protein LshimejAT787_0312000 [Lyophyllum shimeji]|uniref:Uncharacterized protein n=1 Tax=Lyophyllum shimeji TaxID=47721 RepID=A0A9P3PJ52_LYOSH|nr:hypothetical protein LshimejAT787_0312000 [Lyophyllum shimeji]